MKNKKIALIVGGILVVVLVAAAAVAQKSGKNLTGSLDFSSFIGSRDESATTAVSDVAVDTSVGTVATGPTDPGVATSLKFDTSKVTIAQGKKLTIDVPVKDKDSVVLIAVTKNDSGKNYNNFSATTTDDNAIVTMDWDGKDSVTRAVAPAGLYTIFVQVEFAGVNKKFEKPLEITELLLKEDSFTLSKTTIDLAKSTDNSVAIDFKLNVEAYVILEVFKDYTRVKTIISRISRSPEGSGFYYSSSVWSGDKDDGNKVEPGRYKITLSVGKEEGGYKVYTKEVEVIKSGSLTVSKDSAFVGKSIIGVSGGETGVQIGSFIIKADSAEDVTITSIALRGAAVCGSDGIAASGYTNVRLIDMTDRDTPDIGPAKSTVTFDGATGTTNIYSMGLKLKAGYQRIIRVAADVASYSGVSNLCLTLGVNSVSGTGMTSGATVEAPASPVNLQMIEVEYYLKSDKKSGFGSGAFIGGSSKSPEPSPSSGGKYTPPPGGGTPPSEESKPTKTAPEKDTEKEKTSGSDAKSKEKEEAARKIRR